MLIVTVLLPFILWGPVLGQDDTDHPETCYEGQIKGRCDCTKYNVCLNGQWQLEEQTVPDNGEYASICENCTDADTTGGCSQNRMMVVCINRLFVTKGSTSQTNDEYMVSTRSSTTLTDQTRDTSGGEEEMCPCACEFKDQIEFWENSPPPEIADVVIESKINEIKKELQVNVSQLTSMKIKKISAPDSRMSASMTGYVGVVFIVLVLGSVIILDFPILALHVRNLFRRLKSI